MSNIFGVVRCFVLVGALIVATGPLWAQQNEPVTARAGIASLASLKQYHEVPNFRLGGNYNLDSRDSWANGGEGGVTLESLGAGPLRLSYIALGTPKRNATGEIVNAIVVNAYYSGDANSM